MSEVMYPVIVSVDGDQSYTWFTLAQANERFVVVGNRLVVNNVEPLSLRYAEVLLEQAQKSLTDLQEDFDLLCEDVASYKNNERFINECLQPKLDKCRVDIVNAEHEVNFLKKAIVFLKS